MIELQELKSYDDLPSISLDDVQENPFTEYLNLCFGLILDDIAKEQEKKLNFSITCQLMKNM